MTKYLKSTESKGEKWWVLAFRAVGALMFLIAVYLPLKSLLMEEYEEIQMTNLRVYFAVGGFFLVFGSKSFGIVTNNIGAAFNNLLKKITS